MASHFGPNPPPPHKVLLSAQIKVMVKMVIIKRTKQEKMIEIDTGTYEMDIEFDNKQGNYVCNSDITFFPEYFFNIVEILSPRLRFFGQIHLLNVLNKVHV